ncbi:MAG: LbtU family siderophore porin [Desulfococcaceae bacterium]|jgi:hypothetical protein|nr:LbtU family siderophore porin [Desulfococcaceae bacterium]
MKKAGTVLYLLAWTVLPLFTAYAEETPGSTLSDLVRQIEEQLKEGGLPGKWAERIRFSGTVEAEASYEKTDAADPEADDEDSSDLVLSTAELGIEADILKHVKGNLLFLYEDDEDITVDEGYILLDGEDVLPVYLKAGKLYVPFGKFESNMISDPLTLELGETRETAIEIGFKSGGFYAAAYVFNGDTDTDGDDSHADNYGAAAGYTLEKEGFSMDIGMGYINSLIDSDGWEGVIEEEQSTAESMGLAFSFRDYVPGFCAYAVLGFGPFTVIGEYITMLDEPEWNMSETEPGTLEAMGIGPVFTGEKTAAWNAEIAYTFEIIGKETVFGLAYQGSDHAEEFFPENRFTGVISMGIFDDTSLALEYRHDEFETDDKTDALTAQLAVEF